MSSGRTERLTTERWRRLESLCHAALARPASERAAFLADACGGDQSLRDEVESLIGDEEAAASFLETPAGVVASSPSLVGRRLGAYRIDAPIGAGGMGEVYRAKDSRLGRDVAVKILPAAWAAHAQRRARFEREARAVAALNHPNICIIHDIGHDQGVDFLVMELVDGESLFARLAKGPLPLHEALAVGIEIADALDSAHRQGIVHRDLKPGNVMLARTRSGQPHATQVKLLDFGLAHIVPSAVGTALTASNEPPMTEAGVVLGTLQYMAPEQIEGRPVDSRADIFAFGALFYEMVTGRRAFEGASTAALMAAILRADAPSVGPREVHRIVRRCLAKDPLRRYQSARDLLNDLEEVKQSLDAGQLETRDVLAGQTRRRVSGSVVAWLGAGLLAAIALAIVGYTQWRRPAQHRTVEAVRFQLQPPTGVQILPSGPGPDTGLAVSPDGRWVAFRGVDVQRNEAALYLRSIQELEASTIAPAGIVPFFSPDSRWLGFFAEDAMYKVPVGGGRPQPICRLPNIVSIRGASWGQDDTIVFSLDRALWRVPSAGGEPVALTRPASDARHAWPNVLPGTAAAVFTINEGSDDRWRRIGVVSLKTGDVRIFSALSGTAPRYVSGGHLVYSRFGVLYAAPFDLSRLEITGVPVKILDDVNGFGGTGSAAFDVSASGSLVYIPGANRTPEGEIVWLSRQGEVTPLVEERRRYFGQALDPDDRRLASVISSDLGEADLWVYEIDRRVWTRLTTGMVIWRLPIWSPDGKWVFFTSFKSGNGKVFRMPSEGGTPEQLTSEANSWEYPGSVSPDGTTLLFWKSLSSQSDLMTMRIDPRGPSKAFTDSPTFSEASPRFSPDGHWVAYDSDESGSREIHVRPFPGPGDAIRVSSGGGTNPWWSRDGRELVYQRGPEIWSVAVQTDSNFRHRDPRMLFKANFLAAGPVVSGSGTDRFVALREQPQPVDRMVVYVPNWVQELKRALQ